MKLKLFSFMKSEKPVTASEESENTDALDVTDAADGSEEEAEGGADAEADSDNADEEEGEAESEGGAAPAAPSAQIAQLAKAYNAMGAHVEKLTGEIKTLKVELADLKGDKSAEVDASASKKALHITASQGVPEKAVSGVSTVGASDAPTNQDEFLAQYSKITDPVKAGAFYSKYNGQFK